MTRKKAKLSISGYSIKKRNQLAFFLSSLIPLIYLSFIAMTLIFPEMGISSKNIILSTGFITIFLLLVLALSGYYLTIKDTEALIGMADNMAKKVARINEYAFRGIMNPNTDTNFLYSQLVELAANLTESAAGAVLVPDEDHMLSYVATYGSEIQGLQGKMIPNDLGIIGYCMMNKSPYFTNDITNDTLFDLRTDKIGELLVESIMVIPILNREEILGVLQLTNKKGTEEYNEQDLNIVQNLLYQSIAFVGSPENVGSRHNYLNETVGIISTLLEANGLGVKHHERVAKYCNLMGEVMLDNDREKDDLHTAALLHDVGSIFIEPNLRNNEEIYQRHPSIGADLIKKVSPWGNASIIIQHHHENFNGTGYPEGLSGDDIPLASRILAVAEYFDYLTNDSFQNEKLQPEEAKFEIINCSGSFFDPKVVEVFAQAFDYIVDVSNE